VVVKIYKKQQYNKQQYGRCDRPIHVAQGRDRLQREVLALRHRHEDAVEEPGDERDGGLQVQDVPRGARRRPQRLNEGHERGAEEQGVDDEEGGLDGGGREHFGCGARDWRV